MPIVGHLLMRNSKRN